MNKKYREMFEKEFAAKFKFSFESDHSLLVDKENLLAFLKYLQSVGFNFLADITAVDYQEYFEVVYQLCSFNDDRYLMIKVKLDHLNPEIPSSFALWKTADWLEREVYDLMGIVFTDHPNLERILTWEGFEGHPLRKDYLSSGGRK